MTSIDVQSTISVDAERNTAIAPPHDVGRQPAATPGATAPPSRLRDSRLSAPLRMVQRWVSMRAGSAEPARMWGMSASIAIAVVLVAQASGATAPVTFSLPTNYPAGNAARSIAVADFDIDGALDFAVAHHAETLGTVVSVFRGDGSGGFSTPTDIPAGIQRTADVATGDLNGDGDPDLVAAGTGHGEGTVAVLLGDGAGGFTAPTAFHVGSELAGLTLADVNGDADIDLVLIETSSDSVLVLLGDGVGTFGPPANFPVAGERPIAIASGDLNRDGNTDLAISFVSTNTVSVLLGDGTGGFGTPATFSTAGHRSGHRSVAIDDLNGDRNPDVAVANLGSDTVSVLLGDGMGALLPAATFPTGGTGPTGLVLGDLNFDGWIDVAVVNGASNDVSVLLGDGAGRLGDPTLLAAGVSPSSTAMGDLSGDGRPDLAVANSGGAFIARPVGTVSVLLNTTNHGTLAPSSDST